MISIYTDMTCTFNRMTRLAMSNSKLRDELDKSREMSNRLTDSIRKLTEDLAITQRELSEREKTLKDTFLVYSMYKSVY